MAIIVDHNFPLRLFNSPSIHISLAATGHLSIKMPDHDRLGQRPQCGGQVSIKKNRRGITDK